MSRFLFQNRETFIQLWVKARHFSATSSRLLQANHPLIGKVDWELIASGQYAVVDPLNKGSLLHVSYQDYLVLVRVAMSNNITLSVIAAPGETKPLEQARGFTSPPKPDKNSPPLDHEINRVLSRFFFPNVRKNKWSSSRIGSAVRAVLLSPLHNFSGKGPAGTLLVQLTDRNIRKWLSVWHDTLHWYSRGTVPGEVTRLEVSTFGLYLLDLFKNNGIDFIIQRFKISLFVVNAYLGGRKLTCEDTEALGQRIRLSSGLPSFLPLRVREGIRYGNQHYIHIWTSVLNAYKGILGNWDEPNLAQGTIAQKHPMLATGDLYRFGIFARFVWRLLKNRGMDKVSFHVRAPFFSVKAGPNAPNTILGAGLDAYLWYSLDKFGKAAANGLLDGVHLQNLAAIQEILGVKANLIREWLLATGQAKLERQIRMTAKMFALSYNLFSLISRPWTAFLSKVQPQARWIPPKIGDKPIPGFPNRKKLIGFWLDFMGDNIKLLRLLDPTLSRLHNLYEAAGKVRTIAIVDYWTNFVLKPLHDWMFKVLQMLPQDATFDQEGRVEAFASRGYKEVYSYDLKSATDLIPITLYKYLFGHLIPRGILEIWLRLLTDRSFRVPESVIRAHPGHPTSVRYNTGQPMGALTSWASMALLHHFLVLFSAYTAGVVPLWQVLDFVDYLVLGDDIVIADARVAKAYVELMERLHIPIGLVKSHISKTGMFNFANQTFVDHWNVSPISMKEDLNAKGLLARIALVMRMARRGWLDMESRSWLSNLLRRLTNSVIWYKAIVPLAKARGSVPILHWIVASTLLPGTSRFGYTGLSVDPRLLLMTYVNLKRAWSSTLRSLQTMSLKVTEQSMLSLFTARWVDSIYQQFLSNRQRLAEFDTWVTRVISVDIEWLWKLIFGEYRAKANENWAEKYRIGLKEIQVATKIPGVNTVALLEIATGRSLEDLFKFIEQAEAELPLVPDFSESTLSSIVPKDEGGMPARDLAIMKAQYQAMLRVASLLVMLEQVPQDPNRPGTVPGRNENCERLERIFQSLKDSK